MQVVEEREGELVLAEADDLEPGTGEVRIAVRAAGVNRADLVQRAGRYPPPPGASTVLGLEVSGVVDAVGDGVTRWQVGDPVCALLTGGGYATQVVVPEGHVLPVPGDLDVVDAAALPEVFATAHLNLRGLAGLDERDRVLLHAGASGVGTAAIQLCRVFGARSFVTVGTQEKVRRCVSLGADGGAVRHEGPWREAVERWAPDGVDIVLDPVGASYLDDDLAVLRTDGRLVLIGLMGGRRAELDLGRVLMKRLRIQGSTLRARTVADKIAILSTLEREVWPHLATGEIRPVIHARLPLAEAERAHAVLSSNETVGKVLLVV